MQKKKTIYASEAITRVSRELRYSRSHIALLLRENRKVLGASKRKHRWVIPPESESSLRRIVQDRSGRRYKLGERGPHA